jgi:hypothetical protein
MTNNETQPEPNQNQPIVVLNSFNTDIEAPLNINPNFVTVTSKLNLLHFSCLMGN